MPFANQHSGRIIAPSKFIKSSFRSKNIAPGIRIIIGRKRPSGRAMVVQAVRFDSRKFTAAQAKAWLRSHGYSPILFEKARNNPLERKKKSV